MTFHQPEDARIRALHSLNLLQTPVSESFDRITRMAAQLFDAPVAAVSLTDVDRQWFKSRLGCGTEIPREKSPCAEVTRTSDLLVIPDLSQDDRFTGSVLVASGMKFYAGAPLTTRDGFTLGAMCVLDTRARDITPQQADSLRDLAAMVMSQIELQHALGRIDPVSGLPNRNQFHDDLADMARDRPGAESVALMVDLHDPLPLAASLRVMGPDHLDHLLLQAVPVLQGALPQGTLIYQLGAAQIGAVLPLTGTGMEALGRDAGRALAAIPGAAGRCTLGLVPFRLGLLAPADVLRAAHGAAQDARESSRVSSAYSPESDLRHQRRFDILTSLREAAPEGFPGIQFHYQPRLDLASRRCMGAEALIRWTHPALGRVPPDEFIPLAEHADLIRPLTDHAVTQALGQAAHWHHTGLALSVSVNVSAADLEDAGFGDRLMRALERADLPPHVLEVEFTETAMITNPARVLETLGRIRRHGIGIAIDDFGTGYSSFSYLQDLPATVVKIDRSFIRDIESGGRAMMLVQSITTMAHGLGMRVVAEGIETEAALAAVRACGCDEGQGYLFAPALSAPAFDHWLAMQS